MPSTDDTVREWLDTFSKVDAMAENPDAIAKEFDTIAGVFRREGADDATIGRAFQHIKLTVHSRAWPTAAQVYDALRYIMRDTSLTPVGTQKGDRNKLAAAERAILYEQVLPNARRWLRMLPSLRHHAIQTLEYWTEPILDDMGRDWTPKDASK